MKFHRICVNAARASTSEVSGCSKLLKGPWTGSTSPRRHCEVQRSVAVALCIYYSSDELEEGWNNVVAVILSQNGGGSAPLWKLLLRQDICEFASLCALDSSIASGPMRWYADLADSLARFGGFGSVIMAGSTVMTCRRVELHSCWDLSC
ncbi:hypothetical protein BDV96DRAFT_592087 [Lophiotrema nucula]|uniref:Uncharacterized protein n=1 Tax=Lophiotrema nucula TaxID=690887 RepID=A0A6A5YHN1_9PLEO|nr:hypothetical protein BDV96DRAFT_592087 [Lophiotrema nucula]